jgi:calcium-dependent protein kinase
MRAFLEEVDFMAKLDHPGIIKVYEYFEGGHGDCVSQVMEPCFGGELQARIDALGDKGKTLDDIFMKDVTRQTLRALAFMHEQGVFHRDLKPQNIMLVSQEGSSIKIIDFGLSERLNSQNGQDVTLTAKGSLLYMCPENFTTRAPGLKGDIWSLGVILYNMVCGDEPQHMDTFPFCAPWPAQDLKWWNKETARIIVQEPMKENKRLKSAPSLPVSNLMKKMLAKDVDLRPTAVECLTHEWFKETEKCPTLSIGIVQCLEAFSKLPELRQDILLLVAHQCALPALIGSSVKELESIFTYFDDSNKGTLSTDNLRNVLSSDLEPILVDKILHALDRDGDDQISWTEFIAAAICNKVRKNAQLIDAAFAFFDTNGDGVVDSEELSKVFLQDTDEKQKWVSTWSARIMTVTRSSQKTITKKQLRKYMCRRLDFVSGGDINAIS